ncbi:hypothetical protein [Methanocella arvoryzae]|uniref:Uncharacterized protein n=1 Tax=Methanocella arvoryzae (strain DSM 22066 / NBRC 105507 / MRE50) TaxID=351160 RepID=Q0W288_METAR|nr:hypothetical protein [Methanocella arvoryzae]CAJ37505.1 hypothetical protein RCIX2416 [Methanocella arvoryzae MRE50]
MDGKKYKPLSGGQGAFSGSIEGKIVIVLVLIVIVLGAVTFALFSTNKAQEAAILEKQAEYDALSVNFSQISADYATLNANFNRQTDDYLSIKANYDNVSELYNALLNKSSLVDNRLNTFLEADPAVSYTYRVEPKVLPDGRTDNLLTIDVYNVGKTDVAMVNVLWTLNESGSINAYNKSLSFLRTLDKRQVTWEYDSNATLVSVWAGVG